MDLKELVANAEKYDPDKEVKPDCDLPHLLRFKLPPNLYDEELEQQEEYARRLGIQTQIDDVSEAYFMIEMTEPIYQFRRMVTNKLMNPGTLFIGILGDIGVTLTQRVYAGKNEEFCVSVPYTSIRCIYSSIPDILFPKKK